jgi:hypothetical protein
MATYAKSAVAMIIVRSVVSGCGAAADMASGRLVRRRCAVSPGARALSMTYGNEKLRVNY